LVSGNRNGYTPRYKWAYREAGALRVIMMMGHTGRYLEMRRADSPDVDSTKTADALRSSEARTAAMAHDSAIETGRLTRVQSSSKWLT
jgi:hypothetical protein